MLDSCLAHSVSIVPTDFEIRGVIVMIYLCVGI